MTISKQAVAQIGFHLDADRSQTLARPRPPEFENLLAQLFVRESCKRHLAERSDELLQSLSRNVPRLLSGGGFDFASD